MARHAAQLPGRTSSGGRLLPKRTLVREILGTQLAYAALLGVIAMSCLWWVSNLVVRDNINDWAARWITELDSLGIALYRGDDEEKFLQIERYVAKFPEILYVRYYAPDGTEVFFESHYVMSGAVPPLGVSALNALAANAGEAESRTASTLRGDETIRIVSAIVVESIDADGLFELESLADIPTRTEVVGFVELGLDYQRDNTQLVDSVLTGSGLMAVAFLILMLIGRIVLRRAVQPLVDMQAPLARLADGEMTLHVDPSPHREIASIQEALNTSMRKIRERDERLQRLANFDVLTGLPNRHHVMELATKALADEHVESVALLFVDLDHFKFVNDTFGHGAGDQVLAQVAARIKRAIGERGITARFGGDEFAVLIERISPEGALGLAQQLAASMEDYPLVYENRSFNINCSVGVAVAEQPLIYTATELFAHADLACHEAKSAGRGRACLYHAEAGAVESLKADIGWSNKLKDALKNDGFELYLQPIRHMKSETVSHYEVLLRVSDVDSITPPAAFVSAANRFGLMPDIDRWVISHALELLARVRRKHDVRFTVNVSGASFADPGLAAFVREQLERFDLPATCLIIEVTEQVAVGSFVSAVTEINELREIGCEFAIDDFGAGYSSMNYLRHLPMRYIKIDGAFVRKLCESEIDQLIVRAIADIARATGKETIAEYVEDEATWNLLAKIGIDYAQGYWVGRPSGTWFEDCRGPTHSGATVVGFPKTRRRA